MRILIKFPTRQRPAQFVQALNGYIENQTTGNVRYLVTIDDDDESMKRLIPMLEQHELITLELGTSANKINACNRGVNKYSEPWDIIVLASDDMICNKKGWDAQLIQEMTDNYPDTDGVLFHNDGYLKDKLNTLCILGRKYYDRFGYIYNPEYKSFWSDNEFMQVAEKLERQTYFDDVLFKHEHPANNGEQMDGLYLKANNDYNHDKKTFDKRQRAGFGI